ncbi:MAG: protein kinase, partial [Kofleriaceae bacterium]|nr:protein kinase [Kofleriaceae bacterium]
MTAEGGIPFGQYTLLRRIARGGMAEVFLAKQRGLEGFDRRVAVKRILPHLADSPQFLKMFLEEARLASSITHPNIVHIYEFGKYGDDYFIAMEFVDGVHAGQIAAITADRPIPWALLARIGADTASALHFAHQLTDENGRRLGLVHRDISPANILVSYSGTAKIVDFGIAKAVAISDQLTNPGTVKGKFTYMSPEQTIGAQLDGRSDVFSLAIVLWEIATGKPLFDRGDPAAAMRAIRDGNFPPVQSIVPSIPPPLAQAIAWAMEVDRDRRATAADLAHALEAYIKSSPELATAMQLGAWISRELPPHEIFDEDSSDDNYEFTPHNAPDRTQAGPRTMAAPPTAAVSVAEIAKSLRAKPPQASRPVPLAGMPDSAAATSGYQLELPTIATIPTTTTPKRTRELSRTPMPAPQPPTVAPRQRTTQPERPSADLAEELAHTAVFQPRDPAEFVDTVERKREVIASVRTVAPAPPRGAPDKTVDTRRPAPPPPQADLPPTSAVVPPPRRGIASVP